MFDCVVVGGGPGGLVAAIYLKRFKRLICLVDSQNSRADGIPKIQNLIGFVSGISGRKLLDRLNAQASKLKIKIFNATATITERKNSFEINLGNRKILSKTVVIATGMEDIKPSFQNLEELERSGLIAYCPICDIYEHQRQAIGLIVCNSDGFKKLKFISRFSKNLHVFKTRHFKLSSAHKKMAQQLGVQIHTSLITNVALTNDHSLIITTRKSSHRINFAYIAMGTRVPDGAFKNLRNLRRTREGFLLTNRHQETNIQGVYGIGDCVNGLSQISVAIGQAAIAATDIHNKL